MKPSIFDYTDYRLFLGNIYKYYKTVTSTFSYRFIAYHTGAASAGWFPNIIKGRINLTSTYLIKLATLLKLNSAETDFFELLVNYNQAASIEDKKFYYTKLLSIKGIKPALLQEEHLTFFKKWYISIIRELLFLYPFNGDSQSLGKMLIPEIPADETSDAIDILKKLSLTKLDSKGFLRPVEPVIKKDPSIKTDLWASHMKSKIKLGINAIDHFSKHERDISEVYIPLSKEGFLQAREEIAKLRKKLLVISESDRDQGRVYQCTLQLFPLTKEIQH